MLLPFLSSLKETKYEDFFICLSKLVLTIDCGELKQLVNVKELYRNVVFATLSRPIIEDRYSDNEDKVLAGQLLLLTSLL